MDATAVILALAVALIAGGRLWGSRLGAVEVHRRGARVVSRRRPIWPRANRRSQDGSLTLAGTRIPASDETKHFKLIGTTGTGKSTAICELLGGALARGDRAIVTDPGGAYRRRFHERYRGDVILNPFEADSRQWDLFSELRQPFDAEELASGLIPSTDDASAREWRQYARTFLSAVSRRCHQLGRRDAAELWRLIAIAGNDELRELVAGTPAQPFLEPDNTRMFACNPFGDRFRHCGARIHRHGARLPCHPPTGSAAAGVCSSFPTRPPSACGRCARSSPAWNRLAIFEVLSREEEDQRVWFIIDELDALGVIDGLKDALPRLRKFGGRCVLGFQSVAPSIEYLRGRCATIIENCGTTLILRCSGSDGGGTAQFASRLIGEREVIRRQITRGRDHEGFLARAGSRRSTRPTISA